MASAKKTTANKAANRPCPPNLGPPDANLVATGTNGSKKMSSDKKITKAHSNTGKIFRYAWQKHNPSSGPDPRPKHVRRYDQSAYLKLKDRFKNNMADYQDQEDADEDGHSGSDSDFKIADDGEDEDGDENDNYNIKSTTASNVKATASSKVKAKKPKERAPDPNGRVVGRDLIPWNRVRMAEKLILHLQFECHRAGILLPWDAAVKRLHPGSKGNAALQHLLKLRDILITEGHLVPPLLGKRTVDLDPEVRGYIRNMMGNAPTDVRVVNWGENIVDRKVNIFNPDIIRGSGNYPRTKKVMRPSQFTKGNNTNGKVQLLVTFNLSRAALKKFPAGTGDVVQDVSDTDAVQNMGDRNGGYYTHGENYDEHGSSDAMEEEFFEDDNAMAEEHFDDEAATEVNSYKPVHWTMGHYAATGANSMVSYENSDAMSFEAPAEHLGSDIGLMTDDFKSTALESDGAFENNDFPASGSSDNQLDMLYSPYDTGEVASKNMVSKGAYNQEGGISSQPYASYPHYHTPDLSQISDATTLSSSRIVDLSEIGFGFVIATDHTATEPYNAGPSPLYFPENSARHHYYDFNHSDDKENRNLDAHWHQDML